MTSTLRQLSDAQLQAQLASGLRLRIGPFNVALAGRDDRLAEHLSRHYPDYELAPEGAFAHAGVRVEMHRPALRPWRRAAWLRLDDGAMFSDFAPGQALPYVEWAINWCIATRCHFYLMLHAAVVEKHGVAMIMPGLPGAGKSTLSSYLAHNGWRLLSDEFCLVRPGTIEIVPFPRLVPLKNESIDVIRAAVPEANIGPRFAGTRKGTVAHVVPTNDHARCHDAARAGLIVKPRFVSGAATKLEPLDPAEGFVELSKNAFNYQVLGRDGFATVAALTAQTRHYGLEYADLAQAAARLDGLLAEHFPPH